MYTYVNCAVEVADQKRSALSAHTLNISATTRTLSLRRLRGSAGGLSKEYPGRLQLARRPAGSRARAGGAAHADIDSIRRARAQFSGFPRRYTVIRYRTDRRM